MQASDKKTNIMQRFAGRMKWKLSLRLCLQQSRTEDRLLVRYLQLSRTSLHTYIPLCILSYFHKTVFVYKTTLKQHNFTLFSIH